MIFRPLSRAPSEGREKRRLIGFVVGAVHYGIDLMRIREIINPAALVAIPASRPDVIGVADHRNAVIPILSVRRRFGLADAAADKRTKWILVKTGAREMGLEVDRVTQVIKVTDEQLRDQRSMLQKADEPWIKAVFSHGAGLVFEIDVDSLMGGEEAFPGREDARSEARDDGNGKA